MNEQNPYDAPQARLVESAPDAIRTRLAGHGERLGAAIIDALLLVGALMPAMYFGGYFSIVAEAAGKGADLPFLQTLLWTCVGFVFYVLVQGYPLYSTAQTWGKRLLGICIVDLSGRQPPLWRLLLLRQLPLQVLGLVPFIGGLAQIVDVMMIFRADMRCGHDLIAGTRVVTVMTPKAIAAELRP